MTGTVLGVAEVPKETAPYLMGHVTDGPYWELPGGGRFHLAKEFNIHEWFGNSLVFHINGHTLDLTPTKMMCNAWVAAIITVGVLLLAVRKRGPVPKGRLQTTIEMLYVFVRDELAEKNIPHHAERYVPYLATCFFFILTMNLLGLVPWMVPATSSVYLTGILAAMTFFMTQIAGMRAQGVVGYWKHLVPAGVPWWLFPMMLPIEIIGLFTKPFALMMRLFANMLAGHLVLFFLLGLIFLMHSYAVSLASVPFTFAVYFLEIFVCFLQAYVFTILSSVFIGLASHGH